MRFFSLKIWTSVLELETVDLRPLKKLGCGGDGALSIAWSSYRRNFSLSGPRDDSAFTLSQIDVRSQSWSKSQTVREFSAA